MSVASLAAGGLVDFAQQNLGAWPLAIVRAHHKALAGRAANAALRVPTSDISSAVIAEGVALLRHSLAPSGDLRIKWRSHAQTLI